MGCFPTGQGMTAYLTPFLVAGRGMGQCGWSRCKKEYCQITHLLKKRIPERGQIWGRERPGNTQARGNQ